MKNIKVFKNSGNVKISSYIIKTKKDYMDIIKEHNFKSCINIEKFLTYFGEKKEYILIVSSNGESNLFDSQANLLIDMDVA